MFPDFYPGTIVLKAWVQIGSVLFEAEIVEADATTRTAQVIRLGTLIEQSVPFSALASVALKQGAQVVQAFGRPAAAQAPAWVQYAEIQSV